ncbi:MAG TPA: acyl-CoA dehydrogenase family protein [Actinocrinis sp.]|nr:acyl-CoA dehydrogenase family protein [Actinocrinis sp.]
MDDVIGHRRDIADRFAALVDSGELNLPFPGEGQTRERWAALTALAEQDLALARLAEGHTDALAILHEIAPDFAVDAGADSPAAARWGVWAAEPPNTGLTASPGESGTWQLSGTKAYCSGARVCTRALVTARAGEERRLFAVRVGEPWTRPLPDSWPAAGMNASDTLDITFDQAPGIPVGGPSAYLERPGFQHGGLGVAACWYGGARAVARTLHTAARSYDVGPHALAHLGAVRAQLEAVEAVLDRAAAQVDADPHDRKGGAAVRSKQVRTFTEAACSAVLDRVGRALGAAPLAHDADHARTVTDLTVYLRQHHAERDYATLGQAVAARGWGEV